MEGSPRHAGRTGHASLTVAELYGRMTKPVSGATPPEGGAAEPPGLNSSGSREWRPWRRVAGTPNRRRPTLAAAAMVGVAAAVAVVSALSGPTHVSTAPVARIALTVSQVQITKSYVATASGFIPGEQVRFSWTGPTNGEMGVFPADSSGNTAVRGPIVEKDPPGFYQIIATGLGSGRVCSAPLQVLPPP